MTEQEKKSLAIVYAANTWEKVKKEVKRLGGTINGGKSGRWYRFNLNAPDGFVWNATGDTETLVVEWKADDSAYKRESVLDAFNRVMMGLSS